MISRLHVTLLKKVLYIFFKGKLVFLVVVLSSCSFDKNRDSKSGEDQNKSGSYCFVDFDCRIDMTSRTIDTTLNDLSRLKISLICEERFLHTDTVIFEKGVPCDFVIYRYVHNVLSLEYSFQNIKESVKITPGTFRGFLADKKLSDVGYIGDSFKLLTYSDSSVSLRVPIYFREIDVGEVATIEVTKQGGIKVKSIEKYTGFVPE